MRWIGYLLVICPVLTAATAPAGFPFSDESLSYSINWPSGLSLGEAKLTAAHAGANWSFDLKIDAAVPGYAVRDTYHSEANANLCSTEFDRQILHGAKKASEKTTIADGVAVRKTQGGGGQTNLTVSACAHDALAALFFARRELGQGKVPQPEKILFSGEYPLQLKYVGAQSITIGDVSTQADRVLCTLTLRENQTYEFEIFFARDAARTPLRINAPLAMGAFSMELVH